MKFYLYISFLLGFYIASYAQKPSVRNSRIPDTMREKGGDINEEDSTHQDKNIPTGIKAWTINERFGYRKPAEPDTLHAMYMNSVFTEGLQGEYNTLGNLGTPRYHRIFIARPQQQQFLFTQGYDYFFKPINQFLFTNTLSPFTILNYNSAGGSTDGEDHLKAIFGVNAGKKLGVGMKFDYLYGRGFYQNQGSSHFNYSLYGSYIDSKYQAHFLFTTNHQKLSENGGITNRAYITAPESFSDDYSASEIPTTLRQNWNRNSHWHVYLTHSYSVGYTKKQKLELEKTDANIAEDSILQMKTLQAEDNNFVPKTSLANNEQVKSDSLSQKNDAKVLAKEAQKIEFIPVTRFTHTLNVDKYNRIYQAYYSPKNFYKNNLYAVNGVSNDSIFDQTKHFRVSNMFAISLLEGFHKWAKAGLRAFANSELRHFLLPQNITQTKSFTEHNTSIGGQLYKQQGKTLHYLANIETWLQGEDAGQLFVDGSIDVNVKLFGDTVRLDASGFFHRINPTFYYRHYHSKHFEWDNNTLNKVLHSQLQAKLRFDKTNTTLCVSVDNIKNYTYLQQSYDIDNSFNKTNHEVTVLQNKGAINLFTAELTQKFKLGFLHWDNVITYQKSNKDALLGIPTLNVYSNLYTQFKIARVLSCDLGADVRYFTEYEALDYSPALGSYVVQGNAEKVKIGNYPFVNVYANFMLKHTRFFVMYSHANAGSGSRNYFLTPYYPTNERLFRFGVSWNFFN